MLEMTLLNQWLQQATELKVGESIYLPCNNKQDQAEKCRYLISQRKALMTIDPEKAEPIKIFKTFRDSRHWVVLEKLSSTPLIAFKKIPGQKKVERIVLDVSLQRKRQVQLMAEDGMRFEEVQEIVKDLTVEEFTEIIGGNGNAK